MDELRAAVLRVQLSETARHHRHMRAASIASASRWDVPGRAAAKILTGRRYRLLPDHHLPGCRDIARRVNVALRAEGIVTSPQGMSNVLMTDWGLHLYYNNPSTRPPPRARVAVAGKCRRPRDHSKGACPVADSLFERSILLPIPSCLTPQDEDDIIVRLSKSSAYLIVILQNDWPGSLWDVKPGRLSVIRL